MEQRVLLLLSIALLQVGIQAAFNPFCENKRYFCWTHDPNDDLDPNLIPQGTECMRKDNLEGGRTHVLRPCKSGTYCPFHEWEKNSKDEAILHCAPSPPVLQKIPTEKCSSNSECLSDNCDDGVCRGNSKESSCTKDEDCDFLLYCSPEEGRCKQLKAFGESCSRDTECMNNLGCSNEKCYFYYSLNNGESATNQAVCKTGYVYEGKCSEPRVSKLLPILCSGDQDCQTWLNGAEGPPSTCVCGRNKGGYTYCMAVEGDEPYKDMIFKKKLVIQQSFYCHTLRRFGPCNNIYSEVYNQYAAANYKYEHYAEVLFNDDCALEIIHPAYWSVIGSSSLQMNFTALISVSVGFILYFFF